MIYLQGGLTVLRQIRYAWFFLAELSLCFVLFINMNYA